MGRKGGVGGEGGAVEGAGEGVLGKRGRAPGRE